MASRAAEVWTAAAAFVDMDAVENFVGKAEESISEAKGYNFSDPGEVVYADRCLKIAQVHALLAVAEAIRSRPLGS